MCLLGRLATRKHTLVPVAGRVLSSYLCLSLLKPIFKLQLTLANFHRPNVLRCSNLFAMPITLAGSLKLGSCDLPRVADKN